jgi:hypothetical protein
MPFQPGQSGNPNGARSRRRFEAALLKEIAALDGTEIEGGLRKIAANLVKAAAAGDLGAIESLANRIDGKPAQQLIHANDPDNPLTDAKSMSDDHLAAIAAGGKK